jgi:hypothetical protein
LALIKAQNRSLSPKKAAKNVAFNSGMQNGMLNFLLIPASTGNQCCEENRQEQYFISAGF